MTRSRFSPLCIVAFRLVLLLLFLTGCVLHAPYERPWFDVPVEWRLDVDESSTLCNVKWWEEFNDPVLNELIVEALHFNNDLQVAIARVWEYWAKYRIVRSNLFPQLNATANYARQELSAITSPVAPGEARVNDFYQLLGNVSYQADFWGQNASATEAALDRFLAQREARRTVVMTLVAEVASAYINLRKYDEQLDVAKKTYESRIESYDLAYARWTGGLTSELEVKQAESEMDSAQIEMKQFEILQQQQENLLSVLVGRNPQPLLRGRSLEAMTQPPAIPAGLPSEILEQRPDIREAEALIAAANANIGVARAQFFPQISLTGNYGNESFELRNLFTNPALSWQYAFSVLQPLFTGGRLVAQVDEADYIKIEAIYTYFSTILRAFKEVEDALIFHKISLELVLIQAHQVKVLQDYLHLANLQYDNGQTDYLNVLDAQRKLFEAQLNYAETQGNSFLSVINIYKATGGGWVAEADEETSYLPLQLDNPPLLDIE